MTKGFVNIWLRHACIKDKLSLNGFNYFPNKLKTLGIMKALQLDHELQPLKETRPKKVLKEKKH